MLKGRRIIHQLSFLISTQDGAEVEPEAVDVHFNNPVAQAVQDKGLYNRVITVHGVTAAGVVTVIAGVIFQYIIDGIVQTAERKNRAEFAALSGVIKYDVQNHFDAIFMQLAHHPFELEYRPYAFAVGSIRRFRRKKGDGAISPVIF